MNTLHEPYRISLYTPRTRQDAVDRYLVSAAVLHEEIFRHRRIEVEPQYGAMQSAALIHMCAQQQSAEDPANFNLAMSGISQGVALASHRVARYHNPFTWPFRREGKLVLPDPSAGFLADVTLHAVPRAAQNLHPERRRGFNEPPCEIAIADDITKEAVHFVRSLPDTSEFTDSPARITLSAVLAADIYIDFLAEQLLHEREMGIA